MSSRVACAFSGGPSRSHMIWSNDVAAPTITSCEVLSIVRLGTDTDYSTSHQCRTMQYSGSLVTQDKTQIIVWETGKTRATYVFVNFLLPAMLVRSRSLRNLAGFFRLGSFPLCNQQRKKAIGKTAERRKLRMKKGKKIHVKFSSELIRFRCVWLINARKTNASAVSYKSPFKTKTKLSN